MVTSLAVVIVAALLAWSGGCSNMVFRNDSSYYYDPELKRGIDHEERPRITGSNKYIKDLPRLNHKVIGRDDEVKQIMDNIINYNRSIMIVGKPGFGKSTLAIHAGNSLKNQEGLDVFISNINDQFYDLTYDSEIKSFYDVVTGWSEKRTRKTVLILDDFDEFLTSGKKIKLFKEKFLKTMSAYSHQVSLIVTTQINIENVNLDFHYVNADEIDRSASIEILQQGYFQLTDQQYNNLSTIVEDCPLALKLLVQIVSKEISNNNSIDLLIDKLNKSKEETKFDKNLQDYADIMKIAYGHLDSPAQCCGCCISWYPGPFSDNLFSVMREEKGIPCSESFFEDCVTKLVQNSLLDKYTSQNNTEYRYKMHTLIQRYFHSEKTNGDCDKSYRHMFAQFFTQFYNRTDLKQSVEVLGLDLHHLQKLVQYMRAYGCENKYEAAVLVIAHQHTTEIADSMDYQLLYKSVCQCRECVDYIRDSIGNDAFGRVVMNVSSTIHNYNFIRCDLVTDNYCSKSLFYNPPSNYSSSQSEYNYQVLQITCTCYLMYYYHIIGTLGILGTLPLLLLMKHINHQVLRVDLTTVVFIYLSFLPSVVKLYFGSNMEKIWLNVYRGSSKEDAWLYTLFAQLIYEGVVLWFSGHVFQQKEVLYAASVKVKNLLMLFILILSAVAILQADMMMGIYTAGAAKWNVGVLILLLFGRYYIFDYVASKISNGILLRLFFRLVLSILYITSEVSCQYLIYTSLEVYFVFYIGSLFYMILIARSTAGLLTYLDIL